MLRRVTAVALLCMRAAVRSRVVTSLLALLLLTIIILPLSVEGDGTPRGELTVLLTYTLSAASIILSLCTLWASCAAVPSDVTGGRMQLMMTKPVSPMELWVGKWLGIVLLNIVALLSVFILASFLLEMKVRRMGLAKEQVSEIRSTILACREQRFPVLPTPQVVAQNWYVNLRKEGKLPEGHDAVNILRELKRRASENHVPLAPGQIHDWTFSVQREIRQTKELWVDINYSAAGGALTPAELTCTLLDGDRVIAEERAAQGSGVSMTLHFTALDSLPESLHLRLEHMGDDSYGALLISERRGVSLLIPHGSFVVNMLRVLLIDLGALMLLSALGLSAGAMLSLPVASLAATAALVVILGSRVFGDDLDFATDAHMHGDQDAPSIVYLTSVTLLKGISRVTLPVLNTAPYSLMSDGIRLSWKRVASSIVVNGIGSVLLLAAISVTVLRRRELGRWDAT